MTISDYTIPRVSRDVKFIPVSGRTSKRFFIERTSPILNTECVYNTLLEVRRKYFKRRVVLYLFYLKIYFYLRRRSGFKDETGKIHILNPVRSVEDTQTKSRDNKTLKLFSCIHVVIYVTECVSPQIIYSLRKDGIRSRNCFRSKDQRRLLTSRSLWSGRYRSFVDPGSRRGRESRHLGPEKKLNSIEGVTYVTYMCGSGTCVRKNDNGWVDSPLQQESSHPYPTVSLRLVPSPVLPLWSTILE